MTIFTIILGVVCLLIVWYYTSYWRLSLDSMTDVSQSLAAAFFTAAVWLYILAGLKPVGFWAGFAIAAGLAFGAAVLVVQIRGILRKSRYWTIWRWTAVLLIAIIVLSALSIGLDAVFGRVPYNNIPFGLGLAIAGIQLYQWAEEVYEKIDFSMTAALVCAALAGGLSGLLFIEGAFFVLAPLLLAPAQFFSQEFLSLIGAIGFIFALCARASTLFNRIA